MESLSKNEGNDLLSCNNDFKTATPRVFATPGARPARPIRYLRLLNLRFTRISRGDISLTGTQPTWLFNRHALCEVSRLINIRTTVNRDIIGEELQWDTHDDGRKKMRGFRKR